VGRGGCSEGVLVGDISAVDGDLSALDTLLCRVDEPSQSITLAVVSRSLPLALSDAQLGLRDAQLRLGDAQLRLGNQLCISLSLCICQLLFSANNFLLRSQQLPESSTAPDDRSRVIYS